MIRSEHIAICTIAYRVFLIYDDEEEIINYLVNIDVAFDDTVTPPIIVEGAKKVSKHVRYERNPKNRKEAIKIHGCRCQICGFD